MALKRLGDVVARGSRSVVHAYGRGAVVKVPKLATPAGWILAEAAHVEAVRAVGAPAPRLLGMEEVFGRPASVWERIDGPLLWQQVVDHPSRGGEVGRSRADPVADVARSSLTLLADGASTPRYLPGSDRGTLAVLTQAYLARLQESLEIPPDVLSRWQEINAAARLAEGMPSQPLLEVWRRFAA